VRDLIAEMATALIGNPLPMGASGQIIDKVEFMRETIVCPCAVGVSALS